MEAASDQSIGWAEAQLSLRRLAVREVIERYALGLDRRDLVGLEGCFLPDAVFVVSAAARLDPVQASDDHVVGPGWDQIRSLLDTVFDRFVTTTHFLGQSAIETAAGSARAETYAVTFGATVGDGPVLMRNVRYLDDLRFVGGEWRLAHRRIALDWSTELEPSAVVAFGDRRFLGPAGA